MKLLALMLVLAQSPQPPKLDPNTATKAQLMALDPLVTEKVADSIIDLRPYTNVDRVRRAVTSEVWERIQSKLEIRKREDVSPRPPRPVIPRGLQQNECCLIPTCYECAD